MFACSLRSAYIMCVNYTGGTVNLQEFINYRKTCPVCGSNLSLHFHSLRKQKIRYENDRVIAIFEIDSFQYTSEKRTEYQAIYSLSLFDNTFYIDFKLPHDKYIDSIPISIINKFKKFNNNLRDYKFIKKCNGLCGYGYCSDNINLNLKTQLFNVNLNTEDFDLTHTKDNKTTRLKLINNYSVNVSAIYYGEKQFNNIDVLITKLIPFVSVEETTNRLEKLLIFI